MIDNLLKEFEDLYRNPQRNASPDTDAILVLTGDLEPAEEDILRVKSALDILATLDHNVLVFYSGMTEERDEKIALMEGLGIPKHLIRFQDCGRLGSANTKTQFEYWVNDPQTNGFRNLAIVTSTFHIPRTKRTAGKFLPDETSFSIIGNPLDWKVRNTLLIVLEEIKKIIQYSEKGDILERPR